ncbi:hypothetical protein [Natrialba sp. PRR66]|uniref:VOC family protein n=1 Tax=Natrialba sp. PRR66 TaxID=3098146 RepID=UPI002B1E4195|nr:hypothetical protein [Natrialba sp. PRR66]
MEILNVLTRVYLEPAKFESTIAFYQELFNQEPEIKFAYEEMGLELAQIGSVLLIAGSEERLEPFLDTQATILVDELENCREFLSSHGATIVEEPKSVPTGWNMLVKHPDGTLCEYVQHN